MTANQQSSLKALKRKVRLRIEKLASLILEIRKEEILLKRELKMLRSHFKAGGIKRFLQK